MKVAVSGGSGLIGRRLVDSLAADGHQAVVLSRRPERVRGLPPGSEARPWATADPERLAEELAGVDGVVHLAGESLAAGRWTAERKRRILESRVRTTRNLAEAIARLDPTPGALLQASAVGYYGPRGDEEVDESASPGDDFLAGVCREWEEAGRQAEGLGVRRVVLRTGLVLAKSGGALPRMALPFRLFAGGRVGSGRQWVPWIHLDDEVRAIRFLLESESARGPFNLAAPDPVTNRELAEALGRALGRPSWLPAPAFALRLLLGEMSHLLLTGQRAVPARLEAAGFAFRYRDIDAALADLL